MIGRGARILPNVRIAGCRKMWTTSNAGNNEMKKNLQRAGWVGVGLVSTYGVSSLMYTFTASLMTTTPIQSFYYGFVGGCVTAGAIGVTALSRGRLLFMHPESAAHAAMALVKQDAVIAHEMGHIIAVSSFKSFKSFTGHASFQQGKVIWNPAAVNVTFKVDGEKADAIATASVVRKGMSNEVSALSLDLISPIAGNDDTRTIMIRGSEESWLPIKEQIRKEAAHGVTV